MAAGESCRDAGSGSGHPAGRGVLVRLFGGFSLRAQGSEVVVPQSGGRLIALLTLKDRPVPRWQVAGLLWPDRSEPRAQANLRTALYRLPPGARRATAHGSSEVRLSGDVVSDVGQLRRLARALIGGDESAVVPESIDSLAHAGDLLPGWDDDWVLVERERLRQLQLHGLESLSSLLRARGDHASAIDAALAAIAVEPLRESAHRCVIRAHLAEGNAGEARRCYERFGRMLADQLGVQPSQHLRQLIDGDARDGLAAARDASATR